MKSIFLFARPYLRSRLNLFCLYIVLNLAIAIVDLAVPYLIGSFIDRVLADSSLYFLPHFAFSLTLLVLSGIGLGYYSGRLYTKLTLCPAFAMNRDALEHVQNISTLNEIQQDKAYLNHRINNDANMLIMFCINVVQQVVSNGLKLFIPITLLFVFDGRLGFSILALLLCYALIYRRFKDPLYRVNFAMSEQGSEFFNALNEQLANVEFLQMQGLNLNYSKKLNSHFQPLLRSALSVQRITYLFSSIDRFLLLGANLALFLWGGNSIASGEMTVGQFTMVFTYFNLLTGSIKFFFELAGDIPEVMVFRNRMTEIFAQPRLPNGKQCIDHIHRIDIENLSFQYPGSRNLVLKRNFCFESGKLYALRGGNGSGKSTFIRLLLGLYLFEQEGAIKYNGIPIETLDCVSLRAQKIAICEQEPTLLADTVQNTLNPDSNTPEEKIDAILSLLSLDRVITQLPDGWNTFIQEGNDNLSGGEKQRIALARTLLKNADLVILDEPTSALDLECKERLRSFLQEYKRDRIVIVSTHDTELIAKSDEVIAFPLS